MKNMTSRIFQKISEDIPKDIRFWAKNYCNDLLNNSTKKVLINFGTDSVKNKPKK